MYVTPSQSFCTRPWKSECGSAERSRAKWPGAKLKRSASKVSSCGAIQCTFRMLWHKILDKFWDK